MLTKDIYGKTLSNNFNNAIQASAQKVKPKVTIELLDSRHLENISVICNDSYANTAKGSRGYYFSESQAFNGYDRQSFTWGVAGALDQYGNVIKADGTWYTMPSTINTSEEDYEFGWWTNTKSNISTGLFATQPVMTMYFNERKINKVVVTTSEYYGQIKSFQIRVSNINYGDLLNKTVTLANGEYKKEIYIKSDVATQASYMANQIEITLISTRHPNDCGRIQEINPIYEVDVTDQIINYSISRTRDVHDSSLPIGGTQTNTLSLTLDNTSKDWNIFNTSSTYGKYMVKDLKVKIATGWRVKKTDDILSNTVLSQDINSSNTTVYVDSTSIFPSGGTGNNFIAVIDPDNDNREIILCNSVIDNASFSVTSRGYNGSEAVSHTKGAVVQFDPYEYVSMGTFYIDEWRASSTAMTVEISASDWSKFLNESTITKGYLLEDSIVGDAVKNILLRKNFPQADFINIRRFTDDAVERKALAVYSFKDTSIDRDGNNIILEDGLRIRFWSMRSGSESNVKDIVGEITRPLSRTEIVLGTAQPLTPDKTALTKDISSNTSHALNIANYSFDRNDGVPCSTYFNGVVDGYFIPSKTNNYNINLYIQNGGARIYLNDRLVGENWTDNKTNTKVTTKGYDPAGYGSPTYLELTAGRPYKIKIEFFHTNLPNSFNMSLYTEIEGNSEQILLAKHCKTISAKNYALIKSSDSSVGGDVSVPLAGDDEYYKDDAVYVGNVILNQSSGIVSDSTNRSAYLQNGGYIRIPKNYLTVISSNIDYTYEVVAKFNNGSFSSNGEYLSSFANASPTNGFEFYYNGASSHGFKIKTSSGIETVSSNVALSSTNFSFITVTIKGSTLSYYVNGDLSNSVTLSGNVVAVDYDTTIGGRGATYNTSSESETAPSTTRSFYIDEFIYYKRALSASEVKDRYVTATIQELNNFPFLFGNDITYRNAIDEVTLAEIGRFYIDEENKGRYEHYYRFFESNIDQHANIQYTISDTSHIISSDLLVQLQANKVTINLSKLNTVSRDLQALWKPDSNTFLRVVSLNGSIDDEQTNLFVSSTSQLAFPNSGYFIIDNEIIKYASKTENTFNNLTRGVFNTTPASHLDGAKIREVRYYQAKYDKAPAFNVKTPLITGVFRIEPDQIQLIRFEPSPYSAEVIIAATDDVPVNSFAIVEGTDVDGLPWGMSIAGTSVVVSDRDTSISNDTSLDVSAEILANIKKYGLKEVKIENIFISDRQYAEKIVNFIVSKMKDPVPIIDIETMAIPKIQLGDRIRISAFDSFDIINGDFWVISHSFSYGASLGQTLTLRKVV